MGWIWGPAQAGSVANLSQVNQRSLFMPEIDWYFETVRSLGKRFCDRVLNSPVMRSDADFVATLKCRSSGFSEMAREECTPGRGWFKPGAGRSFSTCLFQEFPVRPESTGSYLIN